MFSNTDLQNHLETSSTIRTQSAVIAEWNMNMATNIATIGNYRFQPLAESGNKYKAIINSFDPKDEGNFYTGATDSDIVIDSGFTDENIPSTFISKKNKEQLLFSLEDCFGKFRPRSGINKLRYFSNKVTHHTNEYLAERPRYYMADRLDKFKYWTSFRTEGVDYNSYTTDGYTKTNTERGIANQSKNGKIYIDDAAPFVVYKNKVPTNRLVVKMQTNVGTKNLGPFTNSSKTFADPLYGYENQTTPVDWKIQILKDNSWITVADFNKSSTREDGSQIIKADGYVELAYGLVVPKIYRDIFIKAEEYVSEAMLPTESVNGYAYLIKQNSTDIGYYKIWIDSKSAYEKFTPEYGWVVAEETVDRLTNFVTELADPDRYVSKLDSQTHFREFEYISGIRIVAETMNKVDSTLDIIEISPRLCANLSDKTTEFSVTKVASDLGVSGMPVGQLLASTGSLSLFDYDQSFSENNSSSILYGYMTKNIQVKFYEIVVDVKGYDYFVPIKTLYSDGFPQVDDASRKVTLSLRDLYFYFESMQAPQLLIQNASLSYAVALLMDSIGFSNYSIKRVSGEKELIIPYFFVGPDKTVAQVLQDLALSTQTSMFFDEYNNFIVMSKSYMMPTTTERPTSFVLRGSQDSIKNGVVENKTSGKLANIIAIGSQQTNNYNVGNIKYYRKYLQRAFGSIRQQRLVD
jgi:hypothetical protein